MLRAALAHVADGVLGSVSEQLSVYAYDENRLDALEISQLILVQPEIVRVSAVRVLATSLGQVELCSQSGSSIARDEGAKTHQIARRRTLLRQSHAHVNLGSLSVQLGLFGRAFSGEESLVGVALVVGARRGRQAGAERFAGVAFRSLTACAPVHQA